jgi:hypothetical protein
MTSHEATITDLQPDLGALSSPTVTALNDKDGRSGDPVVRRFRRVAGMSDPTRWATSPTDGRMHMLLPVGDRPPGMFQARCGHLLPVEVTQRKRLRGRLLCVTCLWCSRVPAPVCPCKIPAGRWLRDAPEPTPGGQPVPVPVPPQWARCPVDQHLHPLTPAQAVAAGIEGHRRAGCGRLIPRSALTIDNPAAALCVSCVAVGTAR